MNSFYGTYAAMLSTVLHERGHIIPTLEDFLVLVSRLSEVKIIEYTVDNRKDPAQKAFKEYDTSSDLFDSLPLNLGRKYDLEKVNVKFKEIPEIYSGTFTLECDEDNAHYFHQFTFVVPAFLVITKIVDNK